MAAENTINASIPLQSGPFPGGAAGQNPRPQEADSGWRAMLIPPGGNAAGERSDNTMRINITGKNIEVSEYLKELTEKRSKRSAAISSPRPR